MNRLTIEGIKKQLGLKEKSSARRLGWCGKLIGRSIRCRLVPAEGLIRGLRPLGLRFATARRRRAAASNFACGEVVETGLFFCRGFDRMTFR